MASRPGSSRREFSAARSSRRRSVSGLSRVMGLAAALQCDQARTVWRQLKSLEIGESGEVLYRCLSGENGSGKRQPRHGEHNGDHQDNGPGFRWAVHVADGEHCGIVVSGGVVAPGGRRVMGGPPQG